MTRIASRVAAVDGVVGVCLGGSRARGRHRPDSDWDLGLYYRGVLDTDALRALARELTGGEVDVTEPGGWGPWVDGGAWLVVDDRHVDWIYRDLDRVRRIWSDCVAGRFEVGAQPGHPLGFYSHSYVGELALGRVLGDPTGELATLQRQLRRYPERLRAALVADARWQAPFTLSIARKAIQQGDSFYVSGCLFRAVGVLVHAICGDAGEWLLNEKGAVRRAAELPAAPAGFEERVREVFAAIGGGSSHELSAALDDADRLTTDVLERLP